MEEKKEIYQDVEDLNKILKDFHGCTLEGKCLLLTHMLLNLRKHCAKVKVSYEDILKDIEYTVHKEKI